MSQNYARAFPLANKCWDRNLWVFFWGLDTRILKRAVLQGSLPVLLYLPLDYIFMLQREYLIGHTTAIVCEIGHLVSVHGPFAALKALWSQNVGNRRNFRIFFWILVPFTFENGLWKKKFLGNGENERLFLLKLFLLFSHGVRSHEWGIFFFNKPLACLMDVVIVVLQG